MSFVVYHSPFFLHENAMRFLPALAAVFFLSFSFLGCDRAETPDLARMQAVIRDALTDDQRQEALAWILHERPKR